MILIVDDEINIRVTLKEYLEEEGYKCLIAANAKEALAILEKEPIKVVILDLRMPVMNGLEFIKLYRELHPESLIQFLMITGFIDSNSMRLCFKEGAIDYLYKPITLEEIKSAVDKGLEKYSLASEYRRAWNKNKEKLVHAEKLKKKKHLEMVQLMLQMVNARDKFTEQHCKRVCEISGIIGQKMGLSTHLIAKIKLASLLHDVGKIAIPDKILLKTGQLTPEEYKVVKEHSQKGYEIIKGYVSKEIAEFVLYHHEQFDGKGYPFGLVAARIPLGARIIALADVYDALRNYRPYRRALSKEEAVVTLNKEAVKYDPIVLQALFSATDEIENKVFSKTIEKSG